MRYFYPRSPCGERHFNAGALPYDEEFLSTLSLRRATEYWNGYPRLARISIHALLAESDSQTYFPLPKPSNFYPRSPCGERRYLCMYVHNLAHISIHALLAESDWQLQRPTRGPALFLSTLSLRRATADRYGRYCTYRFLSTLSLRRATAVNKTLAERDANFYPRSPCGERHQQAGHSSRVAPYFYPRSPCGERLHPPAPRERAGKISIHALLAESDLYCDDLVSGIEISIHALLAESD